MELQRPRLTPFLPQWDLGIVPEALSKPPYEPLREASLKHLTLKTVFLLAMASGGRRSKLQAFLNIFSLNLRELGLPYISDQSLVLLIAQCEHSSTITDICLSTPN